jgi:hypothetical protein
MRIQLRAICPICFNQQAVRQNKMVQHGYIRPNHYNESECPGTGKLHFGTPEGLDTAKNNQQLYEDHAASRKQWATEIRAGKGDVIHLGNHQRINDPTPAQRESYAYHLDVEGNYLKHYAESIQRMVNDWKLTDPVEVETEKRPVLIHWMRTGWGKACAGSANGAHKGLRVLDTAKVTCPKCLEIINKKS